MEGAGAGEKRLLCAWLTLCVLTMGVGCCALGSRVADSWSRDEQAATSNSENSGWLPALIQRRSVQCCNN